MTTRPLNRRAFLRSAFGGIAGSALLLESNKSKLLAGVAPLAAPRSPDDEHYWGLVKEHYSLEPGLIYLNNGALGPSPRVVADATNGFRAALDGFPSKYMFGDWYDDKEVVRAKAAELLGCVPDEVAITHNTTEGLNLVASSLELGPGDEVIMADHEHQTGVIPFQHFQESRGAKMVRPTLPILPNTPGELVDIYKAAITPKTKAILICHMVNTNGMILPVQEVCHMARERGIVTVVDGAQTAAIVPTDVKEMDCDFYATSCHKWLHSPKGVGLFYARAESQHLLKPMIVSIGYYKEDNARRFENYNTRNMPEVLGMGSAIDFHNFIGGEAKYQRILALKTHLRGLVEQTPGLRLKTPGDDRLSAGITDVEVVGVDVGEVAKFLQEEHNIATRPMSGHGLNALRVSTSIFNTKAQLEQLVAALEEVKAK